MEDLLLHGLKDRHWILLAARYGTSKTLAAELGFG
jgi:hypothetical protein